MSIAILRVYVEQRVEGDGGRLVRSLKPLLAPSTVVIDNAAE
jgi:hypothetical protein